MSIRKWWSALAAAAALVTTAAIADSAADAKKAIQLQYDHVNAAIAKRDMAAMYVTYSPSFVGIDKKGHKFTLEKLKEQTQVVFSQARTITGTSKIVSISVAGGTAQVRVAEHSKLVGSDPSTRTDLVLIIDSTSDDVWVLNAGRWLQTKAKARTSTTTLNGRLME